VPYHYQVDVFTLQAPGGLGPRIASGGSHHQIAELFGYSLFHQIQTGRGILRSYASKVPYLFLDHGFLLKDKTLCLVYQMIERVGCKKSCRRLSSISLAFDEDSSYLIIFMLLKNQPIRKLAKKGTGGPIRGTRWGRRGGSIG
jgi:hypothetical protein